MMQAWKSRRLFNHCQVKFKLHIYRRFKYIKLTHTHIYISLFNIRMFFLIISVTIGTRNWYIWVNFLKLSYGHPYVIQETIPKTIHVHLIFKPNYFIPFLRTTSFLVNFSNKYFIF